MALHKDLIVVIFHFRPDLIDFTEAMAGQQSLSNTLKIAEESLGVPKVIEAKGKLLIVCFF